MGVASAEAFAAPELALLEVVPGEPLLEVSASAYGPGSVLLAPADTEGQEPKKRPRRSHAMPAARGFSTARGQDTHRRQAHAAKE
ncbi:hypothetical protein ACFVUB_18160 [Streptomyces niveus]|uniref:hypothetical protein n=1 Tax=Streptomyces niveus TaxID=193462 RepID=UPI0036DAFC0C